MPIDTQALSEYGQAVNDSLAGSADAQNDAAVEQGQTGLAKVTMHADGKVSMEGHKNYFDDIIKKAQEGVQLKHQVSQIEQVLQGELGKIQTRENAYNRSPILSALANIAGNLAQQKNMPGFVQALGRSSVELNPGPSQLQGQKLNILGALEQAQRNSRQDERQAFTEGIQTLAAVRQMKAQQDTEQRDQNTATAKMMTDFAGAAAKKEFDPESARAVALSVLKDPDKADALVKHYQERQAKQEINDQIKESIKDKNEQVKFDQQMRKQMAMEDFSLRKMMMMQSMKDTATEAKANAKEMEIPKTLPDKLQALDAAEKSLNNVEQAIAKYGHLMGPVYGRVKAPVASYFHREVSQAETNLKLEVAQAIRATGAGARGFGPQERTFFEKLATGFTKSPQENLGVVDAWRQYLRQQRSAYVDAYKGLSDPKFVPVFGKDKDLLDVSNITDKANTDQSVIKTKLVNGRIVIDDGK